MNGAGANEHFAAVQVALFAANDNRHAGDLLAIEQNLGNRRPGHDRQVLARPHIGAEIAHGRRGTPRRRVAHRQRAVAVAEISVHVCDMRHLPLARVAIDGACQRRPLLRRRAADGNGAAVAVQLAVEIAVALEFAEIRQDVVPAPARGALFRPAIVVGGHAAQRHHAHDTRAAAHNASLVEGGFRRIVPCAPVAFQPRPHVAFVVIKR